MIALLVALACGLLVALQPWAPTSVAPQLGLAPGIGVALGEATPVEAGSALAVAEARPVPYDSGTRLEAEPATVAASGADLEAGIAPARALSRSGEGRSTEAPEAPGSEPPTAIPVAAPESPPEAITAPTVISQPAIVTPGPGKGGLGGGPSGPISAGTGEDDGVAEPIEIGEGEERTVSFSFYVAPTAYRVPGDESAILRFIASAGEAPTFALQIWDDGIGGRGLWASGAAMGGERFLAPLAEGVWHSVALYFVASGEEDGLYLLTLDGEQVDMRAWVSLLPAGGSAWLETGLFREGLPVLEMPDVFFGPVDLDEGLEPALP